jgi:hypothetical protein
MVQHSIACMHGVWSMSIGQGIWRHGFVSSKPFVLIFWEGWELEAAEASRKGKDWVVGGKVGRRD